MAALPESLYLSLNVSADTVVSGRLERVLADINATRVVLEMTVHVLGIHAAQGYAL